MRQTATTWAIAGFLLASTLEAQQAPPPAAGRTERPRAERDSEPQFDPAAAGRGQALLIERCGFCHGSNARGGSQGSDLTRSAIVQDDENGKQLGEFLRVGRPERNMPKFELSDQEVSDLATFLHATIFQVSNRQLYKILDIVVGDAKAGEKFFHGAGNCASCHSPSGDLKGVGAKYDPAALQGRFLMPRGGRGGPGARGGPPYLNPSAVKATLTFASPVRTGDRDQSTGQAGESFTGPLVRLTDFDVTVYDAASGQLRTWLRHDDVPKVALTDPLQAHVDLWREWTDKDMHDMTAYLVTLK